MTVTAIPTHHFNVAFGTSVQVFDYQTFDGYSCYFVGEAGFENPNSFILNQKKVIPGELNLRDLQNCFKKMNLKLEQKFFFVAFNGETIARIYTSSNVGEEVMRWLGYLCSLAGGITEQRRRNQELRDAQQPKDETNA